MEVADQMCEQYAFVFDYNRVLERGSKVIFTRDKLG